MANHDSSDRLVRMFFVEAGERCESITRDLLALERGESGLAKRYENVARDLHTLKGSAGTLGLDDLQLLAHRLEATVLPHQSAGLPLEAITLDVILGGLDAFMLRLRAHAEGRSAALDGIEQLLTQISPSPPLRLPPGDESIEIDLAVEEADHAQPVSSAQTWRVDAEQVIRLIREIERLRVLRLRLDERRRDLERVRSMVSNLWHDSESYQARALLVSMDAAIAADGQEASDTVDALEQGVKDIATQPVRVVVEPLHRAVRDLCRQSGKEAELSLVGGEVSLDRRIIEALKGPLVHLIRNAVDHGIETPDERRARGKHRVGAIVIRIEQQGNVVFIEVSDDGGGLKLDEIRSAALAKRLVTEAELAQMAPEKLWEFVFLPTFSTATAVSATSGRGIGMDAVKKGLDELHGHVEVQSTPLQGTRVLLTFPAGLGSTHILVVRTEGQPMGIPMLSVQSIVAATALSLLEDSTRAQMMHEDQLFPVVDLGSALGLRPRGIAETGHLLLMHSKGQRAAVVVDEVLGDMDLVIRPLPREVARVPVYQGASSLARGEIVLILRPDWLIERGMAS